VNVWLIGNYKYDTTYYYVVVADSENEAVQLMNEFGYEEYLDNLEFRKGKVYDVGKIDTSTKGVKYVIEVPPVEYCE